MKRKVTHPSCLCNCTAAFEASAYNGIHVAHAVDAGARTITQQQVEANQLAVLMSIFLCQLADAAFNCTSRVIQSNRIVMSSKYIKYDMFEQAALA